MTWSLVLGVVVSLLVVEFTDWCPSIAAGFVRLASRMLPAADRARYCEEWLAEVEAVPGRLTRIVKAGGLVIGIPLLRLALAERARQAADDAPDPDDELLRAWTAFVDGLRTGRARYARRVYLLYGSGKAGAHNEYLKHFFSDEEGGQSSPR